MRALFCTFPLLLGLAALPAQDKLTLRLQLPTDKPIYLVNSTDMLMTMDMAGRAMETTTVMQMFTEMKVVAVKDGVHEIEQKVYRMKLTAKGPMLGGIDYDSDVEGSKAGMMKEATEIVGKTVRMKVDNLGKVQEVTLPEDFEGGRSEADVRRSFEQSFPEFPAEPVAIGGTWKTTSTQAVGQAGEMQIEVTNKLVAVEGGKAKIEQTLKVDTSKLQMPGGMQVTVSDAAGQCIVDAATGVAQSMNSGMKTDMSGEQGGMVVKVVTIVKSAVERTEAPAPKEKKAEKPADAGKGGK